MNNMRPVAFGFIALSTLAVGCSAPTSEERVEQQVANVYTLTPEEFDMAKSNAKAYFEKAWKMDDGTTLTGLMSFCRPTDSNFNGIVTCVGQVPNSATKGFQETKIYAYYKTQGVTDSDDVK
jgi:hypothetical protein